jgi:hypothetical protein
MDEVGARPVWLRIIADMQPGANSRHDVIDGVDDLQEMLRAAHAKVDVVLQNPSIDATALGARAVMLCELILRLGVPVPFDHRGRRFRLGFCESGPEWTPAFEPLRRKVSPTRPRWPGFSTPDSR